MSVPLPAASQPSHSTTVGTSASRTWSWRRRRLSCRTGNSCWYCSLESRESRSHVSSTAPPRGREDKPEVVSSPLPEASMPYFDLDPLLETMLDVSPGISDL